MSELITMQAKFISSVTMFVVSWFFAQAATFDPLISQGFDQLISLGFFVVATIVLWRALNEKNKEHAQTKKEVIDDQKDMILKLFEEIEKIRTRNEKD